ncbi:polysaccharide biosynthesis/export family protein [Ohtaekwangia koreensis]|jgi:polysaccharide export outer membrane protein|uniref:Polysaccharide export outer membrane protein n=1 Tax=Ohtaekwangia koreensis TaxID=688867 RepID=A0A1T5M4H6_9BACT|nr:polysaccharide biosynthesis/export family protein [Ohtaekwangia koreensis]SKC83043.1 polysaccharide export outer membrane protein [Ohtaekwangia koreensis]
MTRICLILGVLFLLLGACVPNRKIVYLQKDDLKHRDEIPKDTILRSHVLKIREYRIQPLDILSINFETLSKENDDFDFLSRLNVNSGSSSGGSSGAMLSGILVDTHGEIDYAVLGKIKVSGLTLFQAKDSIQKRASQFMPDVVVRVRMLNFRYTVLGEVNGERTVQATNTRLTMMEAIGLAGGLSELADRSHVKVLRQSGDSTKVFYVDLLKEDYIESPYYFVQQNDVIIVPPLRQRPFRRYFTNNLGIITTTISFIVLIVTLSR